MASCTDHSLSNLTYPVPKLKYNPNLIVACEDKVNADASVVLNSQECDQKIMALSATESHTFIKTSSIHSDII